jgi:hypothetical protein
MFFVANTISDAEQLLCLLHPQVNELREDCSRWKCHQLTDILCGGVPCHGFSHTRDLH